MSRLAAVAALGSLSSVYGANLRVDQGHLRQGHDLSTVFHSTSRQAAMPAFLMSMAQDCQCVFEDTCSCQASVEFMQCIADACSSKKCNCEDHHFDNACTQMSDLCPVVGLSCTAGEATCTASNGKRTAAWQEAAPVAAKKEVAAEKAEPAPEVKESKASSSPLPAVPGVAAPEVFPVPTTARCIVIIVCLYMLVFTALALVRSYHEFTGSAKGSAENALTACTQTLGYGPMLCVLFIACRMRVEFLSDGKDQPQMWVQDCMYATTFAMLATCVLVLTIPLLTGKPMVVKDGEIQKPEGAGTLAKVLTAMRYLIQLGMYGGIAGVIVGINTYTPPGEDDVSKLPPPAPAVMCTMILSVLFFAFQIVIAACRSYTELTHVASTRMVNVMNSAAETIASAPMIAIVFLAARMRALQHDGQPQAWAQDCMFSATYALCLISALAVIVPFLLKGEMEVDPRSGQAKITVPNPTVGYVMIGVRYICMLGMYVGVTGVIISIFKFEAPAGRTTLPVSPTVQCVVNLCCQYFFIFLCINIMMTLTEAGAVRAEEFTFFVALNAAKTTVAMAPMLSILFVTTRMYALLITDKKGAPQAWVQDGMFMATWALMISFCSCLLTCLVMDKVEFDEDRNVVNKFSNKGVAIGMACVRYLAMLLQYGGIVCVIVGLFQMTPETANGRGSIPVVTDAVNSTPLGNAPPGVNDVPGVSF